MAPAADTDMYPVQLLATRNFLNRFFRHMARECMVRRKYQKPLLLVLSILPAVNSGQAETSLREKIRIFNYYHQ
jgi:hypothetical protein